MPWQPKFWPKFLAGTRTPRFGNILNFGQNPSRQFSYLHCLFPNFRTSKPPPRGLSTFLSSCISNANLNKQQISEAIRSCGACSNVQVPNPVSGSSPWRMACVTWTSSPVARLPAKQNHHSWKTAQLLLRNSIFTAAWHMKTSSKTPPFNQATASGWQLSFNILTNQSSALVTCFHLEVDEIRKANQPRCQSHMNQTWANRLLSRATTCLGHLPNSRKKPGAKRTCEKSLVRTCMYGQNQEKTKVKKGTLAGNLK